MSWLKTAIDEMGAAVAAYPKTVLAIIAVLLVALLVS